MANYISVECPHCGKEAARLRLGESAEVSFTNNGKAATAESEAPPDEVLSKLARDAVLSWPFRSPQERKRLQTRAVNILELANIGTIGELISNSKRDMASHKNCGPHIIAALSDMLQSMNLSFSRNGRYV